MTRLVVRRRLFTPRRLLVVAILSAVGVVVAIVIGHSNGASGSTTVATPTTIPCHDNDHTVNGATLTAIEGLHQLALANIGRVAADPVLERYVVADKRPAMRHYLTAYPAPFVAITSTVLGWQSVSYDADVAVIRLATSDTVTTAGGDQKTSQAATSITLRWEPTQNYWRLAEWHVGDVNVADVIAHGQVPCS